MLRNRIGLSARDVRDVEEMPNPGSEREEAETSLQALLESRAELFRKRWNAFLRSSLIELD